ncbi:MAG: hypothetical protein ACQEW5_09480 [Bacillota bacterium]
MAASTKKRKKRIKRQLQKRFKQTSGTVIVSIEPAKEYKAHILYKGKYGLENQAYQVQLDQVYGGKVRPIERFINQNATLIHSCSECSKEFYAKPRWLIKDQSHDCKSTSGISSKKRDNRYEKKAKKVHGESSKKKGASLANKLDDLIQQGLNPRQIRAKTGVDIQIVEYYKETFHTKKQQG